MPGADRNQTRIYPWPAHLEKPDLTREAVREETREAYMLDLANQEDSIPRFSSEREEVHTRAIREQRVIETPPKGESYGMHYRKTALHRLDVTV